MIIKKIISVLEGIADPSLQEHYDNAGLLTGNAAWDCTGIICTLDVTEDVVNEAVEKKCNLIVAHHPIIFGSLKKINGKNYVERIIITAIKNDVAIYAIHTNLDNVMAGVNGKIASLLNLQKQTILAEKENTLKKLYTFVPSNRAEEVRFAIFEAGAGQIGNYSECSFNTDGKGTFKAGVKTNPYVGNRGQKHSEAETRVEIVFPAFLQNKVVEAMKAAHPYEEVAYDIITLANNHPGTGAGIVGELPEPMLADEFLTLLKRVFKVPVVRHTTMLHRSVKKVALCGGVGSFLIYKALEAGADVFVTADMKYHEFFDTDGRMMIADIGHYESEQFTIDLLKEVLEQKFPTFAVLKTGVNTNPVHYF
ncbi:MAG: Nif3-like dinuclear metal center hexameric protein [Chitinophagaceae bacterium]|nr:Nif3-like dinuclear metal center hexameric protein [Chitinophagaceae bacterium]